MADQPEFLYRYRSLSGRSCEDVERILAHRQIRFSSPKWFNDPYDCKVLKNLDASDEAFRAWLQERCRREIRSEEVNRSGFFAADPADPGSQVERKLSELWPRRREILDEDAAMLQDRVDSSGVLSLSEVGDDILMWSHYANGHRGICLKFRRCALKFPIGAPPYENFHTPEKVNYSESYPGDSLVNSSPPDWYRAWLMTKSSHWCYEQEWRVVLQADPPRDDWHSPVEHRAVYGGHPLPMEALAGVICGCAISPEDEKRVREWLKIGGVQVPILRARKKPGRFELDVQLAPGGEGH